MLAASELSAPSSQNLAAPRPGTHHLAEVRLLQVYVAKFQHKNAGVVKTNILRLTLLAYLRTHAHGGSAECYRGCSETECRRLEQATCEVLAKWWDTLLSALVALLPEMQPHPSPSATVASPKQQPRLSNTDKLAYLECVLRLVAAPEWHTAGTTATAQYRRLLVSTLNYAVARLSFSKHLSLSNQAYIGKIFAYAFWHLPQALNALLFLLNTRQSHVSALVDTCYPDAASGLASAARELDGIFPATTTHMLGNPGRFHPLRLAAGTAKRTRARYGRANPVTPPPHPVPGIADPQGPWVLKWRRSGLDVFALFVRHYLAVLVQCLARGAANTPAAPHLMMAAPGMLVVMAHVRETVAAAVQTTLRGSGTVPHNAAFHATLKIWQVVRDVVFNLYPEGEDVCVTLDVVRCFDRVLVLVATTVSPHTPHEAGVMLDLVAELADHVLQREEIRALVYLQFSIEWSFWLACAGRVADTELVQCHLRALAFMYRVWDHLPSCVLPQDSACGWPTPVVCWGSSGTESVRWDAVHWVLLTRQWLRFFNHWLPLVRLYYIRLVLWRLVGVADEFEADDHTRWLVETRLRTLHDCVQTLLASGAGLDTHAAAPIALRRFAVVPTVAQTNSSDQLLMEPFLGADSLAPVAALARTYAYDIFDESIYTLLSAPVGLPASLPRRTDDVGQGTLFTSAWKLFRRKERSEEVPVPSPSPRLLPSSSTNLALLAFVRDLKLGGPPMPQLQLQQLLGDAMLLGPSSTAPLSYEELVLSNSLFDNDSILHKANVLAVLGEHMPQAPEQLHRPPELIRPRFKFQLVQDPAAVARQMGAVRGAPSVRVLAPPPFPRLPRLGFSSAPTALALVVTDDSDCELEADSGGRLLFLPPRRYLRQPSQRSIPAQGPEAVFVAVAAGRPDPQAAHQMAHLGRALAEWAVHVLDFEQFVNAKSENGVHMPPVWGVVPHLGVDLPKSRLNGG